MKINLKTWDIFIQYNDITNIDYFCRLYVTFIAHLLFFIVIKLLYTLKIYDILYIEKLISGIVYVW